MLEPPYGAAQLPCHRSNRGNPLTLSILTQIEPETNGSAKANAQLIAQAPRMYEACKTMDAFIESWLDVLLSNMTSKELHQYHDVVKKALAKANRSRENEKA